MGIAIPVANGRSSWELRSLASGMTAVAIGYLWFTGSSYSVAVGSKNDRFLCGAM